MPACPACVPVEMFLLTTFSSFMTYYFPNFSIRGTALPMAVSTAATAVGLLKYSEVADTDYGSAKVAVLSMAVGVADVMLGYASNPIHGLLQSVAGGFAGYNMVKSNREVGKYKPLAGMIGAAIGALTFDPYTNSENTKDLIKNPIPTTMNQQNIIEADYLSSRYEGTASGDLYYASTKGGCFFGRGGLDFIVANDGLDRFFFSLCSTRIINGATATISYFNENTDPNKNDEIHIFCTKLSVKPEDLSVKIFAENGIDVSPYTLLSIKNPVPEVPVVAISVLGEHPNLLDYVHLNLKWIDSEMICSSNCSYSEDSNQSPMECAGII